MLLLVCAGLFIAGKRYLRGALVDKRGASTRAGLALLREELDRRDQRILDFVSTAIEARTPADKIK